MKKAYLTNHDVQGLAEVVSDSIFEWARSTGGIPDSLPVYAVPRGGIPAAYAVMQHNEILYLVDDPEAAAIVIDDLIDSGATAAKYNKPFFALIDKKNSPYKDQWIVFPWEITEKEDSSGEDIGTRLLQYIGEDPTRGGLLETPKRFVKAWDFWTSGYRENVADIMKVFEDGGEDYDQMVLVRDIPVYSHCEHHLASIFGVAHVGYIPAGKICGLSKINRVVDLFARRLQVQERLTVQIADALQEHLDPKGVAVQLKCRHMCMESRGVCQQGHSTITTALRGTFRDDLGARTEFLDAVR